MKKTTLAVLAAVTLAFAGTTYVHAQEVADAPTGAIVDSTTGQASSGTPTAAAPRGTFYNVLFGSGSLGLILWLAIFGAGGFYIYLCVTLGILIRPSKIMPQTLIDNVTAAMKEGDVVKAIQFCENEPVPMAKILTAGLSHVEEGFEVIQEAIGAASDLEIEKLNQQLTWLSVDSNIAPMLGLLGTVQGMIKAFEVLGTGDPDVAQLATAISQALWTTAAGLCVAVPAVCTYYAFRNKANRIVIRMEATTMELIKDLRNVEVVTE
ncbi:MAG: MotA/TolQ/ExbB proton channel family protein [Kiritimatiellaeota bacterium]|nr:MotA/TolQ/ExbB proton channel family protein [Kiritimatiellota bacterium]